MSKAEPISYALVPFFAERHQSDFDRKYQQFRRTVAILKRHARRVVVVDDGAGLTSTDIPDDVDVAIHVPVNEGKAAAIRRGLAAVLEFTGEIDVIVQCDADQDQDPEDASLLVDALRTQHARPVLLIGERYSDTVAVPPYRAHVLFFLAAVATALGFRARDFVSGFRVYDAAFAQQIVQRSTSTRYGIEAEQLAIARLSNATVETVVLRYSRPRTGSTATSKWLQNVQGILAHEIELRRRGISVLCDVLRDIQRGLTRGETTFSADLKALGCQENLRFRRVDDGYTLETETR